MLRLLLLLLATIAFAQAAPRPNIVFILADDLGYGDVGFNGQKHIRTPNLDRLAAGGMRFTQHYAGNAVCAPSRCVLLTGLHPGHAAVRNNREVKPEGQTPLPAETVTTAKLLRENGYTTAIIGKWGLGFPGSSGEPLKQGFDRFFGYNCQREAHNHYPAELWEDARKVSLGNVSFPAHQKLPEDADPNDPLSYARFKGNVYTPDRMRDAALEFIRTNRSKPFFLYFATTIPHLALQVPDDSLAQYRGKWPDKPYEGGRGYLPHPTPRAAYAAMITRLDSDIGKLHARVKELGLLENTVFIFSSDNGPLYDRYGGTDTDLFRSAADFRGRKGSLYEGGIRVPLIVNWPGKIAAGAVSDRVTGFEDWLPTLLELTGVTNRSAVDGISFAPTLLGKTQPPRPFLYREFPAYGGQQMVRIGDWKGVRQNLAKASAPKTELYNLAADPTETNDVASVHPEIVNKIESVMHKEHERSELFPLPLIDRKPGTQSP
jgi:arylsulfatase A